MIVVQERREQSVLPLLLLYLNKIIKRLYLYIENHQRKLTHFFPITK